MKKELIKTIEKRGLFPIVPITNYQNKPFCSWKEQENWITNENDSRFKDAKCIWINKKGENKTANKTGYALLTGSISNITVIDLDRGHKDGVDGFTSFCEALEVNCSGVMSREDIKDLLRTYKVKTPSGGLHLYFKYNADMPTGSNFFPGVDIRNDKALIMLPGSERKKDNQVLAYEEVDSKREFKELPCCIVEMFLNRNKKATKEVQKKALSQGLIESSADAEQFLCGSRNDSLFRFLCSVLNKSGIRNDTRLIKSIAHGENKVNCNPPLDYEEVENIIDSVLRSYKKPPYLDSKDRVIPGLLADYVSKEINYLHYKQANFIYKDSYYQEIKDGEIENIISKKLDNETKSSRSIREVLQLMKIDNIKNDSEEKYLNCKSGIIDLKTFELMEHDKKYFTTFQVPAVFPAINKYEGSRFQQYINTTFWEDAEPFVQELLGVSLLPNPRKLQKSIFLLGEGNNGKSVFTRILKVLNGNKVMSVGIKELEKDSHATSTLVGYNVNIDEDASGVRLEDTSVYKKLVAGDSIFINKKHVQGEEALLNIVLYACINKMPSSADKSFGFIRRNTIVPFNVEFMDKKSYDKAKAKGLENIAVIDKSLEDDIFNNEMDIVLEFALKGLKRLISNNYTFTSQEIVDSKTEDYRLSNDSVYCFYKSNEDGKYTYKTITAKTIYKAYQDWCENNEIAVPVTSTAFGKLFSRHYKKTRVIEGIVYKNVTLNFDVNRH